MAAEALAFHIQGMIEDGDRCRSRRGSSDIAKDAAKQGAIAFMVKVEPADATVRVNITARESQIARIDELAKAAGMTRSGYMVRAALGRRRREAGRTGPITRGAGCQACDDPLSTNAMSWAPECNVDSMPQFAYYRFAP